MNIKHKYEIGGKVRAFLIDFNTMCEFDQITGLSSLQKNIWKEPSFGLIRALAYVALKNGDPRNKEITLERVGSWIPLRDSQKLWAFLLEIYVNEYAPEKSDEETDDEGKKKASR
jgi:hypothetical protein